MPWGHNCKHDLWDELPCAVLERGTDWPNYSTRTSCTDKKCWHQSHAWYWWWCYTKGSDKGGYVRCKTDDECEEKLEAIGLATYYAENIKCNGGWHIG